MVFTGLVVTIALAGSAFAHNVPNDEHIELVPIPKYNSTIGPASARVSLQVAKNLLASFDDTTRQQILFDLNAKERQGWSNLPARFVKRSGIKIGNMSDEQRQLLFDFLSASLGEEGYQSVAEAMAAEAFLSSDEQADFLQWAPENYWLAFLWGTF